MPPRPGAPDGTGSGPCRRACAAPRYGGRVIREPLSLPGRTVIFDYGEVISLSPVAGRPGGDRAPRRGERRRRRGGERFWAAYFAHRDGLDQGTGGVAAYWRAIADDIGAQLGRGPGARAVGGGLPQLAVGQPGVIDVLADLRAGGTPLALLSNAGPDYGSYFRHGPLGDFFAACYVSGELGLLKPHAEIYLHVLDDLGITPAEAVFIDNRESNVAGAEALGITGHVFTDAGRAARVPDVAAAPAAG